MTEDPSAPAGTGGLRLRYTALSDVGRVRKDNQDSAYAGEHLLAVADGVGGSARGDVASSAAIGEVRSLDVPPGNDLQAPVAEAIERAHRKIAELVEAHPELDGTSTTMTVALFDGTRLGVGHVGDSRGYLLRDDELVQLTKDHTFVQTLIDEGRITEEESRVHPHRNLILRAVDGVHETEPDLFLVDVRAGDRVMLCSDGASGVLADPRLASILGTGTVENAAVELVRESLEAGSSDNVTVVVADVIDTADEDPEETAPVSAGPIVVGAAAEKRRGLASLGGMLRGFKRQDTGELEPVTDLPGHPTDPEPVDPEAIRYAPRAPRRFPWVRRVLVVAVVLVLVWLGGSTAYAWSQKQYYVAPDGETVAVYRGLEADLPVVRLHKVYRSTDVKVAELSDFNQKQVRGGISAGNLTNADRIVDRLRRNAVCETLPEPSPSPSASASPRTTKKAGGKATRKPGATSTRKASPKASATPSQTPSPSASTRPSDCDDAS